jgi:tetratricopeptide (TPR) repeat protein
VARQDEKQRIRRRLREIAIEHATKNEWEEAIELNRQFLELGEDPTVYNRLGKAMLELGRYDEALDAYQQTLRLNPTNTIARRNLSRLELLMGGSQHDHSRQRATREQVDLRLFITEAGKTMVTPLQDVSRSSTVEELATGEKVELQVDGNHVLVTDIEGEVIGRVEPKIGQRLSQLINGGNRYIAAIVQSDPRQIRILIREIYQHPSQSARTSFPGRLVDASMYEYITTRFDYEAEEMLEDEDSPVDQDMLTEEFSGPEEQEIGLEDIEKSINDDENEEE